MGKGGFTKGGFLTAGGNTMGLFQGLLLGHPTQGLAELNRIFGVSTLDGTSGVSAFGHSPEH